MAYSGGRDSTVLLDIARRVVPGIAAVFSDTGLEFPEIKEHVRNTENVTIIRPERTFREVIETEGWPVASKKVAEFVRVVRENKPTTAISRRQYLEGINGAGKVDTRWQIPKKWLKLIDAPFKVSEKCCDVMKKKPMKKYVKETGRKGIIGTMAGDSFMRQRVYRKYGCNSYEGACISRPLSTWLKKDILEYIEREGLAYSRIYDMGYRSTGCIFCAFGVQFDREPNRFQMLQNTHPALWKYCIETLGLKEVLDYIGIPYKDETPLFGLMG